MRIVKQLKLILIHSVTIRLTQFQCVIMTVFIFAIHIILICKSYQRMQCNNYVQTIVRIGLTTEEEKIQPQFPPK